MNLTNALTALAGHYASHPELPGWLSIDSDISSNIRMHLAIDERTTEALALITWANTLGQVNIELQRFTSGWSGTLQDVVHVHGTIDGQRITVRHGVTGFGEYIGAPPATTVGETTVIPVELDQLRAFHHGPRGIEFGVAA